MVPRAVALLTALFVLAIPASASTGGAKRSAAKLTSCDAEKHFATFEGDMRAFGRATGLRMRFTLQTRSETGGAWTRVDAPTFDVWLSAAAGKSRYVYDKQVENLPTGAAYRAVVRFRWRSRSQAILARAVRRTPGCLQPDGRANLKALRINVAPGPSDRSRNYEVRVVNSGDAGAPPSAVGLEVNGARLPDQPVSGYDVDVVFEAERCAPGSQLVATVDTAGVVEESAETDNVLTVPCPDGG
ncbi:MAG: CARDB domain-containing protein [Solirubrobacteraceae bacterium]